jgi:hypothetical protein
MDFAQEWLQKTAALYVPECTDETWERLVSGSNIDKHNWRFEGSKNHKAVSDFLSKSAKGSVLYLYGVHFQDTQEVDRVVKVMRPKPLPTTPAPVVAPADLAGEGGGDGGAPDSEGKESEEGGESKEGEEAAPAAAPALQMEEVEEIVKETRTVDMVELHACLDFMPAAVSSATAYFVKLADGAVRAATNDDMLDALEFGGMDGDALGSLQVLVVDLFTPMLDPVLGGVSSAASEHSDDYRSMHSGMQPVAQSIAGSGVGGGMSVRGGGMTSGASVIGGTRQGGSQWGA